MKATIETDEPMIRPATSAQAPAKTVRSPVRPAGIVPVRAASPLFHAWRA